MSTGTEPVDVLEPERGRVSPAGRALSAVLADAGPGAERTFVEFFAANIANENTRAAYAHATAAFMKWCEERRYGVTDLTPLHVASYIRTHEGSKATVRQHLAALRMLFDHLTVHRIIDSNPARSVKGPRTVLERGATPVLTKTEARRLLGSIRRETLAGARDAALISVMIYSFARIGAVVAMNRGDYYLKADRAWLNLTEKGGRERTLPAHHKTIEALRAWLDAAGTTGMAGPLFQTLTDRGDAVTGRRLTRQRGLKIIKRRAAAAGLPENICCHSLRATGITTYIAAGGTLEHAQRIAGHASARTTKLYDRTADDVNVSEIERIVI